MVENEARCQQVKAFIAINKALLRDEEEETTLNYEKWQKKKF
jgi:hypothetical protein